MDTLKFETKVVPLVHLMRWIFTILPLVAGIDKFFNFLTNWSSYLNPTLLEMAPFSAETFMKIVGVIEITAGIVMLFDAVIGGYIISAWLGAVGLTLLYSGHYLDVALRDFILAISCYSMAKLSTFIDNKKT